MLGKDLKPYVWLYRNPIEIVFIQHTANPSNYPQMVLNYFD